MPEELQTRQGHKTLYTYSASGVKLRVKHITATGIEVPMTETRELGSNQISLQTVTDYVGNKIYEGGQLKLLQTPEGYLAYNQDMASIIGQPPTSNWYYYCNLRDHLGSNRVTMKKQNNSMLLLEKTHYYPFGMPVTESTVSLYSILGDNTPDRFKYNNKEFDKMHGINLYDHGARFYDGMIWPTADPLCEKYYDTSPYAFCGNNPLRYVDPTGEGFGDFIRGIGDAYVNLYDGLVQTVANPVETVKSIAENPKEAVKGILVSSVPILTMANIATTAVNEVQSGGDGSATGKAVGEMFIDAQVAGATASAGMGGKLLKSALKPAAAVTVVEETVVTAEAATKTGQTIVGEGMKRVSMEAAKRPGSVTLNNMPKFTGTADQVTSQMMTYNRQWILQQMRSGRPIIDIGLDPMRTNPSIFYQMEQNMMKNYLQLHPNAFQIIVP